MANARLGLTKLIQQCVRLSKPIKSDFDFIETIDEGRMIVVGGSSGLGKTAFCLQIADNIAKLNEEVITKYYSSEISLEELTMRLVVSSCIFENCTMDNVRDFFNPNKIGIDEVKMNLKVAGEKICFDNFDMVDTSNLTVDDVIDDMNFIRSQNPNKRIFVVIDYLQLLCLSTNIQDVLKNLKNVCLQTGINAIIISSLNRESVKNKLKELSAFKGDGAIEYTSDIAILLTTTSIDIENDNVILVDANVLKNRLGRKKVINYTYDKTLQIYSTR